MPIEIFTTLAELEALGVCACTILLLSAQLEALGVCPCRISLLWQNWKHWACAHAEFCCFARTAGIGRVPIENFIALAELHALGVYRCQILLLWQN